MRLSAADWQTLVARHQGDWVAAARALVDQFHKAGAFKRLRPTTEKGETSVLNEAMKRFARKKGWADDKADDATIKRVLGEKLVSGELTTDAWRLLLDDKDPEPGAIIRGIVQDELRGGRKAGLTPGRVGANGVRVKDASETYRTEKAAARHRKTGQPVILPSGGEGKLSSEAERAQLGAWLKWKARKSALRERLPVSWSERDEALLLELANEGEWIADDGVTLQAVSGGEHVRALLDDSLSGGTTLVPTVFDDAVIVGLLLHSEIAPYIDLREIPRGRVVTTPTVGIPTVTWGVPEGTTLIPTLDTTNLIGSLSASIFTVAVGIEFGRDLMADSALDVGQVLEDATMERVQAELDRVIVLGDGVTQPTGILNSAGITAVPSANGAAGPVATADAESLIFGLSKPYRNMGFNPAFIANDVTYRRFKAIPTATGSNERVFGPDTQGYQVFEFPFRVQNNVGNTTAAFAALKKYRLFRRQGADAVYEEGGRELTLRNQALLVVRGRFGGRMMDPAAAVKMTTLPA